MPPGSAAARREARRRSRTVVATALFLVFVAAIGARSGPVPALGALLVGLLLVPGISWLVVASGRSKPEQWRPTLPVGAAVAVGMPIRAGLRSETELSGVLTTDTSGLTWTPTSGAGRLGAAPVHWSNGDLAAVSLQRVWGLIPLAHVALVLTASRWVDLWLRDPRGLARRLPSRR